MYKVIAILLSISETLLVERKRARAKSRKYAYCMRNEEWTVQLQCSGVSLKRTCMSERRTESFDPIYSPHSATKGRNPLIYFINGTLRHVP